MFWASKCLFWKHINFRAKYDCIKIAMQSIKRKLQIASWPPRPSGLWLPPQTQPLCLVVGGDRPMKRRCLQSVDKTVNNHKSSIECCEESHSLDGHIVTKSTVYLIWHRWTPPMIWTSIWLSWWFGLLNRSRKHSFIAHMRGCCPHYLRKRNYWASSLNGWSTAILSRESVCSLHWSTSGRRSLRSVRANRAWSFSSGVFLPSPCHRWIVGSLRSSISLDLEGREICCRCKGKDRTVAAHFGVPSRSVGLGKRICLGLELVIEDILCSSTFCCRSWGCSTTSFCGSDLWSLGGEEGSGNWCRWDCYGSVSFAIQLKFGSWSFFKGFWGGLAEYVGFCGWWTRWMINKCTTLHAWCIGLLYRLFRTFVWGITLGSSWIRV